MNCPIQKFLEKERDKYNLYGLILSISHHKCHTIYVSGTSMTTIPVNKNMHYRIGGQGITVLTTLFLILVENGNFCLNDKIGTFLPKVPNGKLITLQMLCNMTSGLPDIIDDPVVFDSILTDSFKQWKNKKLLRIVYKSTPLFIPGTDFYFGHITNMLLLCTAIEIKMRTSIKCLIKRHFINTLCLKNTEYKCDQEIQEPVFHNFNNVRIPYFEDSTYWNSSWGSYTTVLNSNANDISILGCNLGSGALISRELYDIQMSNPLAPANEYYGMGAVVGGFGLDCLKSKKFPYTIIWTNDNLGGDIGIWAYIPRFNITINIQTNTCNNNDFEIKMILDDLLKTFCLCELIRIICSH